MNTKTLTESPKASTNGNGSKPQPLTKSEERRRKADREFGRIWLSLAMHVVAPARGQSLPVVGITSPVGGEGKSTHCLSLGAALADEAENKVVIVECDLSRPSLAATLGLEARPGLVELVEGSADIEHILQRTDRVGMDVIVAGGADIHDHHDDDILNQRALSGLRRALPRIVAGLKEYYGHLILDMPSLLTNPYSKEMIEATDGVFVTIKSGTTSLADMNQAVAEVGEERMLGVILTGATDPLPAWVSNLIVE